MPEYIDLDKPITVTDTRRIEHETTVRHILDMNKGKYEADDVRPVARGKWIKHNATHVQKGGMYLECSCCHEYITVLGHVFAYCPNCGAKMDGGET